MRNILGKIIRTLRHPLVHLGAWTYKPRWRIALIWYRSIVLPRIVRQKKTQPHLKVIFLAMDVSMWKYDGLYRLLQSSPRFAPLVVVSPRIHLDSRVQQIAKMEEAYAFFKARNYEVLCGLDKVSGEWLNLQALKPDIIFYTQPYNGNMWPGHFFWANRRSLICYAPYSFQFSVSETEDNNLLQNFAWRYFHETQWHKKVCSPIMWNHGVNLVPVGFNFADEYKEACQDPSAANAVWQNDSRKRIIWAPHHSISSEEQFRTSSFLEYADFMLNLRDKYRDKIVIAFKPHPHLRTKLVAVWGEERTAAYYNAWQSGENSFLKEGPYLGLFAGSDALIHCCESFLVEYLYTGKPCLYVYAKARSLPQPGEIGIEAFKAHASAYNATEIELFVLDVVNGRDAFVEKRKAYVEKYLRETSGFAENIYRELNDNL